MKNVNESGRSMVEMLGVLAIIGVLSIGGIAGYTMAMNRYRANEGLAAANLLRIEAIAQDKDGELSYTDVFSGADLPAGVTSIKATNDGKVTIEYADPDVANVASDVASKDADITVTSK